jgi:hypothetical protein
MHSVLPPEPGVTNTYMLPPFFGVNHYQLGCTYPSSEEVSPRSMVASLQNIEMWVLVETP